MLFSEAKGRKVVSTSTAETVGVVKGFVIDPSTRSVVALRLKKTASGDTLRWDALTAFGVDAVTVEAADRVTEADAEVAALADKAHRVLGKLVLTTGGDELGEVSDLDVDPATGALDALVLASGQVAGSRLVGVGSYAVVVGPE